MLCAWRTPTHLMYFLKMACNTKFGSLLYSSVSSGVMFYCSFSRNDKSFHTAWWCFQTDQNNETWPFLPLLQTSCKRRVSVRAGEFFQMLSKTVPWFFQELSTACWHVSPRDPGGRWQQRRSEGHIQLLPHCPRAATVSFKKWVVSSILP